MAIATIAALCYPCGFSALVLRSMGGDPVDGRRCLSRRLGDPQVDPHFGRFALGLDVDHHNPAEAICSVGPSGFDANKVPKTDHPHPPPVPAP